MLRIGNTKKPIAIGLVTLSRIATLNLGAGRRFSNCRIMQSGLDIDGLMDALAECAAGTTPEASFRFRPHWRTLRGRLLPYADQGKSRPT